jgi:sigma-54 dependent transcriptional regulator, acetoin dehydrogenase operon transcriptional activator AcoR
LPLREARHVGDAGYQPVDRLGRVIGSSARMLETIERARLFAGVSTPLLLQGETGSGKETFARAIHECGLQRQGPFVMVNCGGLPHDLLVSELFGYGESAFTGARRSGAVGKIEAAHGGTLFLDEIAELPLDLQPYLLRVLESGEVGPLDGNRSRPVRFRLITSCHGSLHHEVKRGNFRMDLFYRISVTSLEIPALRERTDDLAELVAHFAQEAVERHALPLATKTFAPEVVAVFARYSWPGNLRELRNVVETMVLTSPGDHVGLDALPRQLLGEIGANTENQGLGALHVGIEQLECSAIRAAIKRYDGNLTQAAKALRIARSTLYLKMKKYSLDVIRDEVRFGPS